jgi:hypothetical protein
MIGALPHTTKVRVETVDVQVLCYLSEHMHLIVSSQEIGQRRRKKKTGIYDVGLIFSVSQFATPICVGLPQV